MAMLEAQAGSKLDVRCIASLRRALDRGGIVVTEMQRSTSPLTALLHPFDPDTERWIPAAD